MKNKLLLDAVREVRHTMSRFLSILLLAALAVAFLAGLRATQPDMEQTVDTYFDQQKLMDVRVLSTLGLTPEDIVALSHEKGVAAAEGAWSVDAIIGAGGKEHVVKLHSLSKTGLNAPLLLEGRLPQTADECVTEERFLQESGLTLGDKVTVNTGTGAFQDALVQRVYTIVGIANSPLYLMNAQRGTSSLGTGRVSAFLLLPEEAFDMDFTDAYLLLDGADTLLCYSDDYETMAEDALDTLKPLGDARASLRHDEIIGDATEKLNDAQKEYDDAEAKAQDELSTAEEDLADARKELKEAARTLDDGYATLRRETADAEQELDDAEGKLTDARATLDENEVKYDDGVAALSEAKVELEDARKKLDDGQAEYEDGLDTFGEKKTEFEAGKAKYLDGVQKYEDGLKEYEQGVLDYNGGKKKYLDGVKKYEDGILEYNNAKVTLDDAQKKLDEAEAELKKAKKQLTAGDEQYQAGRTALEARVAPLLAGLAQSGIIFQNADELVAALKNNPAIAGAVDAMAPGTSAMLIGAYDQLEEGRIELERGSAAYQKGKEAFKKGQAEYADGLKKWQDSAVPLEDAKKELTDAKDELDKGAIKLADAKSVLDGSAKQLVLAKAELDDGEVQLADAQKKLDDAKTELDDGEKDYVSGAAEYTKAEAELADARQKLDDGTKEYETGKAEYEDGVVALAQETAKAKRELAKGERELADGEKEYAKGLEDYEQGKDEAEEKLADARKELGDARRKIAEIEDCKWYFLGRKTNAGFVSYQSDAERMGNLASVFPIIFFLVAALVCLTTMTRMVEEQRVQIGGMKALGYARGQIAFKYVGYGFLASLIGGMAGLLMGLTVIPGIIYNAWKSLYAVPELKLAFTPGLSLLSLGAAVATVTGAALLASLGALSAVPAELMRPKAPTAGKRVMLERITPLWKRLSFSLKVAVRNLFRYKKRFWMTVIGIGGCTALIIVGFGLRDSILSVVDRQYVELNHYDSQIALLDNTVDDERADLERGLAKDGNVEAILGCYQVATKVETKEGSMEATLYATEDGGKLPEFVTLRNRLSHAPVPITEDGVIITEKMATTLKIAVGGKITLDDGDRRIEATVVGITENYLSHFVYATQGYYSKIYGEEQVTNLYLCRHTEKTQEAEDEIAARVMGYSGVSAVSTSSSVRKIFADSIQSVDYAVMVIIVAAAALAFVVLYNLTNINITERLRELATLKVLGFYDRELSAYVYRENIFLTIFGILAGLGMGFFLHRYVVLTVEIDMLMFVHSAKPASYLYAVMLTALFSLIVNLAAHRRLKKIDMVESLKTVE